ncbi:cobyric acid synthase [Ameyamaea chiangmaiensis]|uniref:Cobyric acid synthase n=2 Tax=Ameyamaea chiangmaiensis TaxID=442969 RepID=A0A850PBY5_9PROT|nr:cobyric acid synthase [Ameyamaea chiangmaiensis]NVN41458.1 cobyric acid synthase [Ameyamaea chiangmaiensis]
MLQGTGSSVGKSTLVAGLARAFTRRGLTVRPFKPQNMSNNAAVTADGGEIGRAQALQALACRTVPVVDMNPVLLKPQSEVGAQLVVRGRARGTVRARDYQAIKPGLMPDVLSAFGTLCDQADLVLVEGAGSASEVNLRSGDIANMGFAQAADVDVVLVGDIDRGGVIASLVGTARVLDDADRARIKGFVVNRMRGDPTLFAEGMRLIARHTGWQPLGLVPHCAAVSALPAEDAADLCDQSAGPPGARDMVVVVPLMPMIANFDDLDPLRSEPGVSLRLVVAGEALPVADLVILPGSKSTIADLMFLREQGWDIDLAAHVRRGGHVLGICGGYQMLGTHIADPDGIEGPPGAVDGLGLLQVDTVLGGDKCLTTMTGTLWPDNVPVSGYEIHMGRTTGADTSRPFAWIEGRPEGAVAANGRVAGTYLHGVFGKGSARSSLLKRVGGVVCDGTDHDERVEAALDALADHLEAHVDLDALVALARPVRDRAAGVGSSTAGSRGTGT